MLGLEERRKRFSEEVVDLDLKDSVRLQKLYRQIQRQVHCRDQDKVAAVSRVVRALTKIVPDFFVSNLICRATLVIIRPSFDTV